MEYTEEKIDELRHYCQICHSPRRFFYLGSHICQKHKISAREYKKMIGVDIQVSLTDEVLRKKMSRLNKENIRGEIARRFLIAGKRTRFKDGSVGRPTKMMSKMTEERLVLAGKARDAGIYVQCAFPNCKKIFHRSPSLLIIGWRTFCSNDHKFKYRKLYGLKKNAPTQSIQRTNT